MENSRIVEINGVKLEVDLRDAKTVEQYRVGDPIKVLIKSYGDTYTSYPGIIVGFDDFKNLPSIVVAYLDVTYSNADIKIACLNSKSEDIEICPKNNLEITLEKQTAIDHFNREILKKETEADELRDRLGYFLANFGKHFNATNQ